MIPFWLKPKAKPVGITKAQNDSPMLGFGYERLLVAGSPEKQIVQAIDPSLFWLPNAILCSLIFLEVPIGIIYIYIYII